MSPSALTSCILLCFLTFQANAQVFLTKEEALKQYFPDASPVERRVLFLTEPQLEAIQRKAKASLDSKIITYYVAKRDTAVLGYAFLESRTVRTMPAVIMTVLHPDGTVRSVEILAFYEPEDYRPPERWLRHFSGRSGMDDLWLKRGIPAIAGATLSAQSATETVRRTLALFDIVVRGNEQK